MANEPMTDHYKRLELTPTATQKEIRAAHAKLRAEWQELARKGDEQASEQLRLLDEAYATLADRNRRAAYDRSLRNRTPGGALALTTQSASIVVPDSPPVTMLERPCLHCGKLNPIQVTICQHCGQQVARPCPQCGQPVPLRQAVCPRCNIPIQEYDQHRFAEATLVEQRVQHERHESKSRHQALEAMHKAMHRQGAIFWLAVLVACGALTAIAVFVAYLFNG